jgi:hypothetical protein
VFPGFCLIRVSHDLALANVAGCVSGRCCSNPPRVSILGALMAVLHTLAAIGRLIRRTPPPPAELLEAYAHEVIPVLDRAEWLYEHWLEQSTLFTDGEKLGNVAAIHRWETATMGRSLERVIPPPVLADAHERVIDALELASRAAQLLSNGSRFHNANAVCEGQAMLATSRDRRLAALKAMRRYLARVQPAATSSAVAASSEMLAEAAALVASVDEAQPSDPTAADPAADGLTPDASLSGATPGEGEQADGASDAEAAEPWSEDRAPGVIWTDESEPEPAWLSAARADVPAGEPSEAPAERMPAVAAQRMPPTPVEDDVRAPDTVGRVDAPPPELVAPDVSAPEPPPRETPAPNTGDAESNGQEDAPGPETASGAGWGSLFGKTPDQSGR